MRTRGSSATAGPSPPRRCSSSRSWRPRSSPGSSPGRGGLVLAVPPAGVAWNAVATALLSRASRESLNVRGAFLHVATDLAAFVGTALAGALVLVTGWGRLDPP